MLTRTAGDAGSCAHRSAGPVRMSCRAGGLTLRASSTRYPASACMSGSNAVIAMSALTVRPKGFVTRWWWRVPAGEFGLSPDLFDAALVPTERARTFRRVRGRRHARVVGRRLTLVRGAPRYCHFRH